VGGIDRFSVDFNMVLVRINFRAEFNRDLAVNGNPAGNNKCLSFAARSDTGR
jgi:hypothetical protein